ncbi:hypothetical protein BSL78_11818 [Apostichopus japonicus]|uniref:Uncharacterized protein n=1 Tax=Stichopus japonicus TaxID=307972 RepID=A0A2G8KTG7_STIJA|nr:hypothetical protein BSL78_11818 [Apostichopus japonicus]
MVTISQREHKDQFWYWEIVEITRKVSQTCIVILFGWGSSLSIFITIFLAVIFFTLHASFSPMKDKFEQQLQLLSLLAIFLNMLMVAVPAYETDFLFVKGAITFILIFLNIVGPRCYFRKTIAETCKSNLRVHKRPKMSYPVGAPIPERNNNFHVNRHHLLINGDQGDQEKRKTPLSYGHHASISFRGMTPCHLALWEEEESWPRFVLLLLMTFIVGER